MIRWISAKLYLYLVRDKWFRKGYRAGDFSKFPINGKRRDSYNFDDGVAFRNQQHDNFI